MSFKNLIGVILWLIIVISTVATSFNRWFAIVGWWAIIMAPLELVLSVAFVILMFWLLDF